MSTQLNFGRDVQGFNAYAPDFSTNHFSATITNGVEATLTVPTTSQIWLLSFSYQPGTNVWVARNSTAAIPAGATFVASTSELNPGSRRVFSGDVIHFITNNASADVGVSLYAYS